MKTLDPQYGARLRLYVKELELYKNKITEMLHMCLKCTVDERVEMGLHRLSTFMHLQTKLFLYKQIMVETLNWMGKQSVENEPQVLFELNLQRDNFGHLHNQALKTLPDIQKVHCCAKCVVKKLQKDIDKIRPNLKSYKNQ